MARRGKRGGSRAIGRSSNPTPIASACPSPLISAHATDDDYYDDDVSHLVPISSLRLEESASSSSSSLSTVTAVPPAVGNPSTPKPSQKISFLSLPAEIRVRVYGFFFADSGGIQAGRRSGSVIDLDPDNKKRLHRRLTLLRTCRLVHDEASYFLFSTFTFRVFPTHPFRYIRAKKPLLAKLKPTQRGCITSLELRVGPGWSKPPRSWIVTRDLGLADCAAARRLRVFVECDPSDGMFNGFRRHDGFYEDFCATLLQHVLQDLPALAVVEFDGWQAVQRDGAMVQGLVDAVAKANKAAAALGRDKLIVAWGSESGWNETHD